MAKAKTTKKPKAKKQKAAKPNLYPHIPLERQRYLDSLTMEQAEKMLGWGELDEEDKNYLLGM